MLQACDTIQQVSVSFLNTLLLYGPGWLRTHYAKLGLPLACDTPPPSVTQVPDLQTHAELHDSQTRGATSGLSSFEGKWVTY